LRDLKTGGRAILDDPPDAATFIRTTLLGRPSDRDPQHP